MQKFTIRDIENLTGIKAHTWRIWEQRYQFFTSKRKESLHRFYDNEDLKTLLRISFLYHTGWKVSKIAELTPARVLEIVRGIDVGDDNYSAFVTQLSEAAIDFDESSFVALLDRVSKKIGFEKCVTDVCYPYLQKMGLLWSTNNIIPAQEHFSSYIIQHKIISETEKIVTEKNTKPDLVLFCPKGERHELPLLFINYLLKKNKRSTVYLGPNIDLPVLESVAALKDIQFIYLHMITNFTGVFIDEYLEKLQKKFPGKTIVASGAEILKSERKIRNIVLLKTDRQIYDFIEKGIKP